MMMKLGLSFAAAGLILAGAVSAALADGHSNATATAVMKGPGGEDMGTVTLKQTPEGVLISADMKGLTPGGHGFHLHENGTCSPDFKAAGDHYNPDGKGHGYTEGGSHAGDMPNIFAHSDGTVRADVMNTKVTFDDTASNSLFDANGTSIIIHEKPDTYGKEAGAGGRVACGVVTLN